MTELEPELGSLDFSFRASSTPPRYLLTAKMFRGKFTHCFVVLFSPLVVGESSSLNLQILMTRYVEFFLLTPFLEILMEENKTHFEDFVFYRGKPNIPIGVCSNSLLTFYICFSSERQLQDLSYFYSLEEPVGLLSKLTKSLMPKNTLRTIF